MGLPKLSKKIGLLEIQDTDFPTQSLRIVGALCKNCDLKNQKEQER